MGNIIKFHSSYSFCADVLKIKDENGNVKLGADGNPLMKKTKDKDLTIGQMIDKLKESPKA